jgi:Putative Ig domain
VLNKATGIITGTPTKASGTATYTIIAKNGAGSTSLAL